MPVLTEVKRPLAIHPSRRRRHRRHLVCVGLRLHRPHLGPHHHLSRRPVGLGLVVRRRRHHRQGGGVDPRARLPRRRRHRPRMCVWGLQPSHCRQAAWSARSRS